MTARYRRLEAFLDWLHEISGSTLTSLGSGLFLAIQLLGDGWRDRPVWWWLVIVVATLLSISGLVVSLSLRPTRHELLTRVEQAHHRQEELREVVRTLIRRILGLTPVASSTARITVYYHLDRTFTRVARFAEDDAMERHGRPTYPDDQGIIGLTWSSSRKKVVTGLPEDVDEWIEECVNTYRMEEDVCRRIEMRSRSFLGLRLEHANEKIGVLVIESTRPRGLTSRTEKELADDPTVQQMLGTLTEVLYVIRGLFGEDGGDG